MRKRNELRETYERWRTVIVLAALVAGVTGLYWGYSVLGPLLAD